MGEVIDAVAELRRDNPTMPALSLHVFADALRTYLEAADNVKRNGAVCAHPRTGTPLENPYLKVQAAQGAILWKMRAVKSERLLALLGHGSAAVGRGKVVPLAGSALAPSGRTSSGGRGTKSKGGKA